MNHLLKVPLLASRAFSSSARQLRNKVPEAQKLFQADNGLPVHIKGGTGDVLLYRATMTLTIGGIFKSLFSLQEPATLSTGCSSPLCLRRRRRGQEELGSVYFTESLAQSNANV
uniref:Cytochrome c oxidase subunit 7A1, mitochondrial n=1 Tax=Amphiprion ocellaris TaxID=80972 RepID=A0AAQ5YWQ0_AMPOC